MSNTNHPETSSTVAINSNLQAPSRLSTTTHQRNAQKLARIPIKVEKTTQPLKKPAWIRAKLPSGSGVARIKKALRKNQLYTVCEEAACPNLGECFNSGTATFMILGDICTRRCPFCDVAHGKPQPPNPLEPERLSKTIVSMALRYVVITSVDRDDLRDGGAAHFAACIKTIRNDNPGIVVETLVPDFRGRQEKALAILKSEPPNVFNHNLETVPRLYKEARPGANYKVSLDLLSEFKSHCPNSPTKSGLMLGLGESLEEIEAVMHDLRRHKVDLLTLGQYLQPSLDHLPVKRYVTPDEFEQLSEVGLKMGFQHVASGPMVRSSYHAESMTTGFGTKLTQPQPTEIP